MAGIPDALDASADVLPFGVGSPQEAGTAPRNVLDKILTSLMSSAATLPQRAIDASASDVQNLGNRQPLQSVGPALEAAMMSMGTGAIAGVPVRAGEAVLGAGPVRGIRLEKLPEDGRFFIKDREGKEIGRLATSLEGDKLNIVHIQATDGSNSLGGAAIKNIRDELRLHYPGIKEIGGFRVGGSRATSPQNVSIKFDENLVNIIKKYGMAGVSMLPPAAAAFLSQRVKPVDHNPFAIGGTHAMTPVDHDPFNPDDKT